MTVLLLPAYSDLREQDLTGVTALTFTAGNSFLFLDVPQVTDQLAPDLAVDGGGYAVQIVIGGSSSGSVDLSGWSFTGWSPDSHFTIFQSADAFETFIGSSTADWISVGAGDTADGGAGDDRFFVAGGATIRGGEGDDEIVYFRHGTGGTVDGGDGMDTLSGVRLGLPRDAFVDFRDGGSNFTDFFGWAFANVEAIGIHTGAGNDRVIGGVGDDYVDGGADADSLSGQRGNDTLAGGKGEDVIFGGMGRDRLFGGTEADVFVYLRPREGGDEIGDFGFGGVQDSFRISASGFGLEAGPLAAEQLQAGTGAFAATAEVRFIYDTASGRLFFDADGNGSGSAMLLARLAPGLSLAAGDFDIA